METILIIENGWYVELASRLARDGYDVLYWTPSQKPFPYMKDAAPGVNLDGVIRIDDPLVSSGMADIICFPDLYFADWQAYFRDKGKAVWGSGYMESLELNRVQLKDWNEKHRLPVITYEVIHGLDNLESHLKANEDLWVKASLGYRGDFESFHHNTWDMTAGQFADWRSRFGPFGNTLSFVVEPNAPGFELGSDTYTVDGYTPRKKLWGFEVKDAGYVGRVGNTPHMLETIDQLLTEDFAANKYRNLYSTEVRITPDHMPFFIDFAARFPSPPYGLELEMVDNLGDIICEGARGDFVQPAYVGTYGVELILTSPWNEDHWEPLEIPRRDRQFVKLHNACRMGSTYFIPPHDAGFLGSVVGIGSTMEKAAKRALAVAGRIEGAEIHFNKDSLAQAAKIVTEAKEYSIDF